MSWQDRYTVGLARYRFYPLRKAIILECLPPEGLVLELGAGPGVFPELAGRTVALDANPAVLREGSYARACGLNEALPFKDSSFDTVVAAGTLEYSLLPDALYEAHRVLKKGGVILASFPNRLSFRRAWDREVYLSLSLCLKSIAGRPGQRPVHWQVSARDAREILRRAGFRVVSLRFLDANPLPRPAERLLPGLARWLSDLLEPHAHSLIANQFLAVGVKQQGQGPSERLRARS